MDTGPVVTFGSLEAMLADMHQIAQTKRTAFQARLKNFHRLGYPLDLETSKGKAAKYNLGHIIQIALALELTQLGIPPERAVRVLTYNHFSVSMAVRMAADYLLDKPSGYDLDNDGDENDPRSAFIYFDPSSLAPLTSDLGLDMVPADDATADRFFYGGIGTLNDAIVRWTVGAVPRLSIVNVTSLLDNIGGPLTNEDGGDRAQERIDCFELVKAWAENYEGDQKIRLAKEYMWHELVGQPEWRRTAANFEKLKNRFMTNLDLSELETVDLLNNYFEEMEKPG